MRRDAQQDAVIVELQSKQVQFRSVGEQRAVVVVLVAVQIVVGGIEPSYIL